ncbi:hypothetical protein C8J57DRAFT_1497074 [Mycena rebaudengoi]|nr:hypothetical protein C8J57DRAFT_1497074 [Mycena rebaudengoi]
MWPFRWSRASIPSPWTTEDSIYEDVCLGSNYERLARFTEKVTAASPEHHENGLWPMAQLLLHVAFRILLAESFTGAGGLKYTTTSGSGSHWWSRSSNLGGQYPLVEALMADRERTVQRRGMMYIALNPFVAGEFYAVYGDGSTSWNVPTAWEEDLATISKYIEPLPEVASTKPEQVRPATPRKSHWNKEKIEQGLKLVEAAVGVTEILQNLQELL